MAWFGRIAAWLLRAPLVVVWLLTAAVVVVGAGAVQLRLDVSARAFFGAGDPAIQVLDAHRARWEERQPLVVLVSAARGELWEKDRLREVHELGEALRALAVVRDVTSFADHPIAGPSAPFGGRLPVPLYAQAPEEVDEAWRARVRGAVGLVPRLLAEDGLEGALLVELAVDVDDMVALHPAMTEVRALLVAQPLGEGLRARLTGVPALNAGILEAVLRDQQVLGPIVLLCVVGLLWWVFGTWRGLLVPALAAVLPLGLLAGLMGWLGEPVGALNQTYSVLVPVIAVANAIHLLSRYEEELRLATARGERDARSAAVTKAFGAMGAASLFTSLTTIVGFLSLNAGRMPVLAHYGLFAAVGVALAFVVSMTAFPLVLRWTSSAPSAEAARVAGLDERLGRLSGWAFDHARAVLGGALLIASAAGLLAWRIQQDFVLSELLGAGSEVAIAARVVDEKLAGVLKIEVGLEAPAGTFDQPAALNRLAELDAALLAGGARAVWSPAVLARASRSVRSGRDALPDTDSGVRLMWEQAPERLLSDVLSEDRARARVLVHVADAGAAAFAQTEAMVEEAVRKAVAPVGWEAVVTGTHRAAYRGFRGVGLDLQRSVGWAFLGVGLMVAGLFRSARFGWMAVLPNTLPLLLGLGLMGAVGWPLDQYTGVTLTIGLGLCVDDTIHLLARLREERAAGAAVREAVVLAVRHSGHALTTTSVVIGSGFALQGLSSFTGNAIFGVLSAWVIASAWLSNLLIVPALVGIGAGGAELRDAG